MKQQIIDTQGRVYSAQGRNRKRVCCECGGKLASYAVGNRRRSSDDHFIPVVGRLGVGVAHRDCIGRCKEDA